MRFFLSFIVLLLFSLFLSLLPAKPAVAMELTYTYWTGDKAIGSTAATLTRMSKCDVVCTTSSNSICTFAIRDYAGAATGGIADGQVYSLSITSGAHTFWWLPRNPAEVRSTGSMLPDLPIGGYWDDLTGTTRKNCAFYK